MPFSAATSCFGISRSFSESSSTFLVPVPCRRFNFSSTPTHGLCACTSLNVNNSFLQSSVWKLTAIVSGIAVTVCVDLRSALFVPDSTVGAELSSGDAQSSAIQFQDDLFLLDDDLRPLDADYAQPPGQGHKHSLSAVTSICPVSKPAVIVTAIAAHASGKGERAKSWQTLDAWALVSTQVKPLCLHYVDEPDAADELAAAEMDAMATLRPASPSVLQRLSPSKQLLEPPQANPHFLKVEFNPAGEAFSDVQDTEGEAQKAVETNVEGLQKFVFNGIRMVADDTAHKEMEQARAAEAHEVGTILRPQIIIVWHHHHHHHLLRRLDALRAPP